MGVPKRLTEMQKRFSEYLVYNEGKTTAREAAIAAGCNGLFMEVHDNVDEAKSDATTQWPLDQLESLLAQCKMIYDVIQ